MGLPLDWTTIRMGNSRMSCWLCGKSPKDRTCGVTWDGVRGVAHCFRCGMVETSGQGARLRIEPSADLQKVEQAKRETLSDWGLDLFNECTPPCGVPLKYMRARKTVIPPCDGDLRCHPALKHPSGYVGPALVALVTHPVYGHPMTLHRTWVNADGSKAAVDPPRMLLGGHTKQGGVIRLWPDEAVTHGLGIAEGIESALSLAHAFQPVWSLIDAGNLADFPPLPGIESLLIAADNDEAGLKAAEACARHWHLAGREVRMVIPPGHKTDLNDLARAA